MTTSAEAKPDGHAASVAAIQEDLNREQLLALRKTMSRADYEARLKEFQQNKALTADMKRELIREQKLANKAEATKQRREAIRQALGAHATEVQVFRAKHGRLQRIPNNGEYAIDGEKWHVMKAVHYLDEPMLPGPVLIYPNDNPEPIWDQSPKGLTATMVRMLPGGGLRDLIVAAHEDPVDGFAMPRWAFIAIGTVVLIAFLVWMAVQFGWL